jgi:hypothetical protein
MLFPFPDNCTNSGADALVRGRPPGRLLGGGSRLIPQARTGRGRPARTRGSAQGSALGVRPGVRPTKLFGIRRRERYAALGCKGRLHGRRPSRSGRRGPRGCLLDAAGIQPLQAAGFHPPCWRKVRLQPGLPAARRRCGPTQFPGDLTWTTRSMDYLAVTGRCPCKSEKYGSRVELFGPWGKECIGGVLQSASNSGG